MTTTTIRRSTTRPAAPEHPVETALRAAMARFFTTEPAALRPDAVLRGQLAAELDVAALSRALAADLDMDIPDWAVERMRTYGDLVRTVRVVAWARETRRAA